MSSLVKLKIFIPIGRIIPGNIICSFAKLKTIQTSVYMGSIKQIRVHLLIQQNVERQKRSVSINFKVNILYKGMFKAFLGTRVYCVLILKCQ